MVRCYLFMFPAFSLSKERSFLTEKGAFPWIYHFNRLALLNK